MKTHAQNQNAGKITNTIRIPLPQADSEFSAKIGKPAEGANSYVSDFLKIANRIMNTTRSFTFEDFSRDARNFCDIPRAELVRLFDTYTQHLIRLGRLEAVQGVYDYETFFII
jgi:hypothetical protein